jgi:hypothetical protein
LASLSIPPFAQGQRPLFYALSVGPGSPFSLPSPCRARFRFRSLGGGEKEKKKKKESLNGYNIDTI